MPYRVVLFILIFINNIFLISGQIKDLNKVKKDDFKIEFEASENISKAIILHKSQNTFFEKNQNNNWNSITNIDERILFKENQGDSPTDRKIILYKEIDKTESIKDIRIMVYKLSGSKVQSIVIQEPEILESPGTTKSLEITIRLPKDKETQIVDLHYQIESPFYRIPDIEIQDFIPTKHFNSEISIPSFFQYDTRIQGNFPIKISNSESYKEIETKNHKRFEKEIKGGITTVNRDSIFQVLERTSVFEAENIDCFPQHDLIDDPFSKKIGVYYDLIFTDLPDLSKENHKMGLDEILKNVYDSDSFNINTDETIFIESLADKIKSESKSQLEVVINSLEQIQSLLIWNQEYGIYKTQSINELFDSGKGSVADINLALLRLLIECNIDAYPILTTTREYHPITVYSDNLFNYVLALVELDGSQYFIDASNRYSFPNIIPYDRLSNHGLMMLSSEDFHTIDIIPRTISSTTNFVNITVDSNEDIYGSLKTQLTLNSALKYRNNLYKTDYKETIDSLNTKFNFDINNLKINNKYELGKPIIISYDFNSKNRENRSSTPWQFNPFMMSQTEYNPITDGIVDYPLNFSYPFQIKNIINIKIPEQYVINGYPEPTKLRLPNNLGHYIYNYQITSSGLNIITDMVIYKPLIPEENVEDLRLFFAKIIKMQSFEIDISNR